MNVSIPFIRNIHTNYTLPSNVTFSSISHNSSPTSSSGFSSRFPPTLLDSHTATNLVIYIVPAVFGFGIIVALVWWIHLSSKRRARGGAFAKNVNDVEGELLVVRCRFDRFSEADEKCSLVRKQLESLQSLLRYHFSPLAPLPLHSTPSSRSHWSLLLFLLLSSVSILPILSLRPIHPIGRLRRGSPSSRATLLLIVVESRLGVVLVAD